jgi:hypothetical protein
VFIGANNYSDLPDLGLKLLDLAPASKACAVFFSTVFQLSR